MIQWIQKWQQKRKEFEWQKKLIPFRNRNKDKTLSYENLVELFFVKCDHVSDCKTNEIQVAYRTRIIALYHKPTTEPGKVPYISPMGHDYEPPIHPTLVEYSMDPVNGPPLWKTSVYTPFSTKHCKYYSEVHTSQPLRSRSPS